MTDELKPDTYKKILDHCYDEIFVTNGQGDAIYVNEACERHYGLKPQEVVGKTAWQFVEEGICFPPVTPIVLRDKKRVTLEQKTLFGKRLVITATPVFDELGELEMIVQTCRDITQIEATKQDLEQTKQLLLKYKQEVQQLRQREFKFPDLIAKSKQMKQVLDLAHRAACTDSNILVLGESGTGKSMLARQIHKASSRKDGPFISINCAAIPDDLLESELFGYTAGAFTGASQKGKMGLIELAHEGTLFLDEIAEIPLRLQAKLLDVIQERRFIPVGGRNVKHVDFRIIAATNQDLSKLVKEGKFREDLYYRLNVIELEIPPLRERTEDILPLVFLFLNRFCEKYKINHQFSQDSIDLLLTYGWPGNIRELEHVIERLVITVQDQIIEPYNFPRSFHQTLDNDAEAYPTAVIPLDHAVEQLERNLILKAYKQFGSTYKVAEVLKISQSKASRLIRKYTEGR